MFDIQVNSQCQGGRTCDDAGPEFRPNDTPLPPKCFIGILDKPFGCEGDRGLCPRDRLGRFHRGDRDVRAIFDDTYNITFCVMDWVIRGLNINRLARTIDPFEGV